MRITLEYLKEFFFPYDVSRDSGCYTITGGVDENNVSLQITDAFINRISDNNLLTSVKDRISNQIKVAIVKDYLSNKITFVNSDPMIEVGRPVLICNPTEYVTMLRKYSQVLYNGDTVVYSTEHQYQKINDIRVHTNKNDFEQLQELMENE